MPKVLKVIFGNDLNHLVLRLGKELFSFPSQPFERRIIVVPDISLKDFLLFSFAADPRLQIAAGVQILPLNQAIAELSGLEKTKKKIPSFLELSLAIEEQLYLCLASSIDSPLGRYLKTSSEKQSQRIASLSDQLSTLFIHYGLYGMEFLPSWLENEGWQQLLWKEVYSDHSPWTYPLHSLTMHPSGSFLGKIALFGFTYLPPIYLSFFSAFRASLFQLSPCELFWEDMTSEKQRIFFAKAMKKRGTKESICAEIDQYLRQSHPLLGNWGKLRREMLKTLESFELIEEEIYHEPEKNNLLSNLKKSLLTLDETNTFSLDHSIQLHSAISPLREIEILRDALETLLHTHAAKGDSIAPREILVVSPDIAAYAPYIQMVFAQSFFNYAIEGIPIFSLSQAVQGFFQLLALKENHFSLSSVRQLFQCSPFMEKYQWSSDEVDRMFQWFKHAEIREELALHPNSWEVGIDRLLYGLAIVPNEKEKYETWPIGSVPLSEVDLFGRFLQLFESIKADLATLEEEKSAAEWIELFLHLAEKYFYFEWEREPFFQELKTISLSCSCLKQRIWSFASIKRVLSHLSQKPSGEISSSSQLQKIRFISLRQGSLRPASIVWCLGMHEGAFPRLELRNSLCEITSPEYIPSKMDEDRSCFLDLFLHAQDYLIFSFQRLHSEDAKQQGASLLVDELNQYLIQRGLKEGLVPILHPAFPYDHCYFSSSGIVKKWSQNEYKAAKANYSSPDKKACFFETKSICAELPVELTIDISQIKKLARHPLQFYFNETLGIYFKDEEDDEEKEFVLSFLRKAMLRKKALKCTLPQLLDPLRAKGRLPRGLFLDVALQEIEEESNELLGNLNCFRISPNEVTSVHFSSSCQQHEQSNAVVPHLVIPLNGNRSAYVTGRLEDLVPRGLIFHGSNDLKTLVKAWPLYLISLCLNPEATKLFLTKTGEAIDLPVADPMRALSAYVDYFLLAKSSPSPLMPDWADPLLLKTESEFAKAVSKELSYEDVYLDYLNRRGKAFDPINIFSQWSAPLREVFAPLIDWSENEL